MKQKSNQLIHEKSPYLLQHAYNPVNWFTWSDKIFLLAKEENKPILLSIGYSTCHWCHVMEKESFENQEIATYLNEYFISIKVDREERPDIDKVYMDAFLAISHQNGGWPLNMFLTPDKSPITGGTYFPPRSTFHHQGFLELLQSIVKIWQNQKNDILEYSKNLSQHLQKSQQKKSVELSEECFHNSFKSYQKFFDKENFGFKWNGKNKFPPFLNLNFLLQYAKDYQNSLAKDMVKNTLQAIKKGGIYDQLGGGVCRYSTDHHWLVPHFEKMLYDNSLFLRNLSDFYAYSKDVFFKKAAYDVISYIEKDLRLPTKGVSSAEDADSEGIEGKFYLWNFDEIKEICGEDFAVIQKFWNITPQGNFEGKNILHESFKSNFEDQTDIIEKNKKIIINKRNKRTRPLKDDKVLTSWNALYIQSLAKSAMIFSDNTLTDLAVATFSFLQKNLMIENRVFRRFRENEVKHKGYINDYAELILAAIFLYFATFDTKYIQFATDLTENAIELFYSKKGFFKDIGKDSESLIKDSISYYDGVEPSGNSSMAHSLILLNSLGIHQEKYQKILESVFIYFSQELSVQGTNVSYFLSALMNFGKMKEFVIIAKNENNEELQKILKNLRASYSPNMVLAFSLEKNLEVNRKKIPILENRPKGSDFCVYYCENKVCQLPVYNWENLKKYL